MTNVVEVADAAITGLGAACVIVSIWMGASWSIYRKMTRDSCKALARGTYEDFVREFESRQWGQSTVWKGSWFSPSYGMHDSQIHASIVEFGGVGMMMGPWDYWRAGRYLAKRWVEPVKPKVVDWKDRVGTGVSGG